MILLASSLPSRCAAAFKLAMCCDSPAALAGADAGLVGADFALTGAGFFLTGVAADGAGVEAAAAEPDARLSLVLTVATNLPESLTPFSVLICWAMAAGPFSGYLARYSRTRADLLTDFFAMTFISLVCQKLSHSILANFLDRLNENAYENWAKQPHL